MCVAFWLLDKHPAFWLILASNRDEFHARPALPVHFWEDDKNILGGKDLTGGGTWLGVTKTGRLAFLTNVRENKFLATRGVERMNVTSRGALPTRFLKSDKSPVQFLEEIAMESDNYNGFNLVVGDVRRREMAYLSNRPETSKAPVQLVNPGLHSLSNGSLHSAWKKMELGKQKLQSLSESVEIDLPYGAIVEQILKDRTMPEDVSNQTFETGCPEEFERSLSSIFIESLVFENLYGTRNMSVIGIRRDGKVCFFERSLTNGVWSEKTVQFQLE